MFTEFIITHNFTKRKYFLSALNWINSENLDHFFKSHSFIWIKRYTLS